MAPRGLKAALKKSAPAALCGTGKFKGFTVLRQGKKTSNIKLKGLTKRLEKKLWSAGTLPMIAKRSNGRAGVTGRESRVAGSAAPRWTRS